jgi:hypothetical protein
MSHPKYAFVVVIDGTGEGGSGLLHMVPNPCEPASRVACVRSRRIHSLRANIAIAYQLTVDGCQLSGDVSPDDQQLFTANPRGAQRLQKEPSE